MWRGVGRGADVAWRRSRRRCGVGRGADVGNVPFVACTARDGATRACARACECIAPIYDLFAEHIDTDEMELVGPVYEGENKWYGGLKAPNGTIWGTRCKEYPRRTREVPD